LARVALNESRDVGLEAAHSQTNKLRFLINDKKDATTGSPKSPKYCFILGSNATSVHLLLSKIHIDDIDMVWYQNQQKKKQAKQNAQKC